MYSLPFFLLTLVSGRHGGHDVAACVWNPDHIHSKMQPSANGSPSQKVIVMLHISERFVFAKKREVVYMQFFVCLFHFFFFLFGQF